MKLFLTSAGFRNASIVGALRELVLRPFGKLKLVFVPTAANVEEGDKGWLIDDFVNCQKLGFAEVDIVDISALSPKTVRKRFEGADILMFGGGDTFHLLYWIRETGLDKLLPKLLQTRVYVGISAGSMIATPNLTLSQSNRLYYEGSKKPIVREEALGFVDFLVRPHLNSKFFPKVRINYLTELAKEIKEPIYAIDDDTAIQVDGEKMRVVSEGKWKRFN